jgi:hypothetical protein
MSDVLIILKNGDNKSINRFGFNAIPPTFASSSK